MSEDQFTKLFKYIQDFRSDVDQKFDVQNSRFDDVINMIDTYAGNMDRYAQEMAAMDHKIGRLEKYIYILAEKAGVDLDTVRL